MTEQPSLCADDIAAQLDRIFSSSDFNTSERNRRFLSYIVTETLAGRGDRIKAYTIAVSAFDRDEHFDPNADPVIRIEASRLRRALERYYLTAGRSDPILITIPKGHYVPMFEAMGSEPVHEDAPVDEGASDTRSRASPGGPTAAPSRPSALPLMGLLVAISLALGSGITASLIQPKPVLESRATAARHEPSILVAPLQSDSSDPTLRQLARGMTREIVSGLTRFDDLFVFAAETSFLHGPVDDVRRLVEALGVDYVLVGGMSGSDRRVRITSALISAHDDRHLWSGTFDADLSASSHLPIQESVANQVVRALAPPGGAIEADRVREIAGRPPQSLSSYECVLHFRQYWRKPESGLLPNVQDCLERAVKADPAYADAWASLGLLYAHAHRARRDGGSPGPELLPRAMEAAQRAVELAPDAVSGYRALHVVYWEAGDLERSFQAAREGLHLNPNHTGLLADLGARYCLRNEWDKGLPLLHEAMARNAVIPAPYRYVLALDHYVNRRYAAAMTELDRMDVPDHIRRQTLIAATLGQLGSIREADAALARLREIAPDYDPSADLAARNVHPDLAAAVLDGLRKAGLIAGGMDKDGAI